MKNLENWIALLEQAEWRVRTVRQSMEKIVRGAKAEEVLKSLDGDGEIEGDVLSVFEDIPIDGLKMALDEMKENGGPE